MSHLTSMWCFMMSFPLFHLCGKSQYLQIGQILFNLSWRVVQQRILISIIIGSFQILRKIPAKLQDTCQESTRRIKSTCSHCRRPKRMYIGVQPERGLMYLNSMSFQCPREFAIHQNWIKLVSLKIHPTRPVESHVAREIRSHKFLIWSICHKLVLWYLPGWLIDKTKIWFTC